MLTLTYSNGSVQNFPKNNDYTRITVVPEKNADKLIIKTSISLVDVHGIWSYSLVPGPEKRNMPWVLPIDSNAQKNIPFAATFNIAGGNCGSFATTNLQDDTRILWEINQETGCYDITCTVSLHSETSPFDVILDCRKIDWQDVLADWRDALGLPAYSYPAAAEDPVYCTWYAVHGAVTADFVETNTAMAKELGFTTLIVDDGWCYDDMKRVSPETIVNWYEMIGDWNVSEKKFPNFKEHVKRVQASGMKYMVWVAPHLWGVKSELYQANPGMTINNPIEGYDKMDIHKADYSGLVQKLCALAKENGLDGLKIDFLDIVEPDINHPNGRATEKMIAELTDGLKADNPEALIEFRQSYATPGMLKYGTQFRAGDVPFNWIMNFGRIMEIRLAIGNRGPVHADPAYWPFGETAENVARHMMAMLPGVPMLSMDLTRLSEMEKQIIRYYINMYNNCRKLINHGEWKFIFGWSDITAAFVENETERLIVLADADKLPCCMKQDGKRTIVCNLSHKSIKYPCTNAVNAECINVADDEIPPAGSAVLK